MKPKHLVFCVDAAKSKLKFETQKKAENFIKYNSSDIFEATGRTPVRTYYCPYCCAWHVTSKADASKIVGKADKIIDAYNSETRLKGSFGLTDFEKREVVLELLLEAERKIEKLLSLSKEPEDLDEVCSEVTDLVRRARDIGGSKKRRKDITKNLNKVKVRWNRKI